MALAATIRQRGPLSNVVIALGALGLCLLAAAPARSDGELGIGTLLIAGTRLEISPESQTVPYNTPTLVNTHLAGYDPENGILPSDLRGLADFTGPEVNGILVLETVPNEPFRIPRLSQKGEYILDNIRLVQGDELLTYGVPRSAIVLVTQVLVTRVTSRPLTLDEIRDLGIVLQDDSFQAFNFTFGFGIAGDVIDFNVPVIFVPIKELGDQLLGVPLLAGGERFRPPPLAPFKLTLDPGDGPQVGG